MQNSLKALYAIVLCAAIGTCSFFFLHPPQGSFASLSLQGLMNLIPNTPSKVDAYAQRTIALFDEETKKLLAVRPSDRTFTNTVQHWDEIGKMLVHRMIVLKSLSITHASQETLQAADLAFERVQEHLSTKMASSPQVPMTLIGFLEEAPKNGKLTPSEWLYVHQMADSLNSDWFPQPFKKKIEDLKTSIASFPREDYTYKAGEARSKTLSKQSPCFSLLNFNICFLPGSLPLLFGGMTPWDIRVDKIAARILQIDADIICLEEVFVEEAAEKLYTLLKNKYAHFYINIGPRNFGFSQESAGLGSGLFVASKLKIDNPKFILFKNTNYHVNRGSFDFSITQDGKEFAHVYTTHLEAFSVPPGPEFRKQQLEEILANMEVSSATHGDNSAIILCGDLNIPWNSKEPAELLLKQHFSDPLHKSCNTLTMTNRTYVDFTDLWWQAKLNPHKFNPTPEILDYAVILNKLPSSPTNHPASTQFNIITAVIPMNEIDNPLEALSDHHAEISLIQRVSKN